MWNDVYLRSLKESDVLEAAPADWLGEDGALLLQGEGYALDVVGVLPSDPETGFVSSGKWHLNVRLDEGVALPAALEAFEVPPPNNPRRRFA